jgi:hypothetical protein
VSHFTDQAERSLPYLVKLQSIKNIDAGDAQIVLRLAQDFKPGILGVLGNLRFKFDFFKKSNQEATILNQVNVLDGGVTQLMGNLENVVPVCNFPCQRKLYTADQCYYPLPGRISRSGE